MVHVIPQPLDNGSIRYWALTPEDYEAAGRQALDWKRVEPLAVADEAPNGEVTWRTWISVDTPEGRAAIRAVLGRCTACLGSGGIRNGTDEMACGKCAGSGSRLAS